MRQEWKASLFGLLWLLSEHFVLAGTCDDLVARMKAQGANTTKWAGVENEVEASDASLDDRARMLIEAKTADISNLGFWEDFGAAERDSRVQDIHVYALSKAGIGRIEISRGGTMYCAQLGYFRVDAAGRPHVIPAITGREDGDDYSTVCEYNDVPHLLAIDGQVMELLTDSSDYSTDRVTVSSWTGDHFAQQCVIERTYGVTYTPAADADVTTVFDSEGSRFLAKHADSWGHAYLAQSRYQQAKAYSQVYPKGQDRLKAWKEDEAAYRAGLVRAFLNAHPGRQAEVQTLRAALPQDAFNGDDPRYDLLPVLYQDKTAIVVMQPATRGWRELTDLHFRLYTLNAGKAELTGAIIGQRSDTGLSDIAIKPPSQTGR